ncbi:relaxase/mobilization nuclease domain-containing protein, partial [Elstera litoralis]|uniref:relaxase/mobilization nuclease domain-containing protein n=1 Tax=Elstera litoralis TaxID=552518 RepID=UPI000AA65332
MIGKIISSRKDGGSPKNLVKYLIHGRDFTAPERYSSIQFINSPTQFADDFIRDCVARKNASDHSKDNMYHFVLSLSEHDKADDAQLFDAAKAALNELGLKDHSAALVIHRDTSLPHIHIAVDLVNPETFQRVKRPSHDFARLAKVCRIVENQYGWFRAKGHFAGDKAAARELGQPEPPKPDRASRNRKVRDGDSNNPSQSFQSRIEGNQQLISIFRDSSSWDDLQNRLSIYGQAEFGSDISYVKHGSGAVLTLANDPEARGKASLVHHSASLSKLEARFGTIPSNSSPQTPSLGVSPGKEKTSKKDDLWNEFENRKALHQSDKADIKARKDALRNRQKAEMDALKKQQATDRRTLLRSITDHQTRLRLDSERALKAAQSRELLEQKHSSERKSLSKSLSFPSWREWLLSEAK